RGGGGVSGLRWVVGFARGRRLRLAASVALGVATAACAIGLTGTSAWLLVRASEMPPVLHLMVAIVAVRAFGIGRGVLRYLGRPALGHLRGAAGAFGRRRGRPGRRVGAGRAALRRGRGRRGGARRPRRRASPGRRRGARGVGRGRRRRRSMAVLAGRPPVGAG